MNSMATVGLNFILGNGHIIKYILNLEVVFSYFKNPPEPKKAGALFWEEGVEVDKNYINP